MRSRLCALVLLCGAFASSSAQRPVEVAPNAPKDKPVNVRAQCQWDATVRAMEPYVAKARATYPGAKQRFLSGLPARHTFFVTTRIRDRRGVIEQVFIAVDSVKGERIVGRIWSDLLSVVGFRRGQRYEFTEGELIDWMVARPDGSEEGNVVGIFLDSYRPPDCASTKPPSV